MSDRAPDGGRYPFVFTGSGGEYFRIWIVNVLLSIVTLYVYSAWAKVRTRRYFAGNTVLDGSSFEYHARPLQILAGRVVAVLLLLAVTFGGALNPLVPGIASLVLLGVLPWAVWRSTMFNARMTSYRNVRFGFGGGLGRMYLYVLVLPLLPLVLGGIAAVVLAVVLETGAGPVVATVALGALVYLALVPWVHRKLAEYFADNHAYGRAPFDATLSTGRFYAIYLLSLLVAVVAFPLVGAAVGGLLFGTGLVTPEKVAAMLEAVDAAEGGEAGEVGAGITVALLALYPLLLLVAYFVAAFFRARLRNHLYANTVIDGRARLDSSVRTWPLWRLMVGNLLLLVVTLGLAHPWTRVRIARFHAARTAAIAPDGLHAVVDDEHGRQGALGEELGDAFDMDVDVGF